MVRPQVRALGASASNDSSSVAGAVAAWACPEMLHQMLHVRLTPPGSSRHFPAEPRVFRDFCNANRFRAKGCQELPTDEAVVAWNDQTIHDFHDLKWTAADPFLKGIYARPIYNITLINEYLRESTDEKLSGRKITGTGADDIKTVSYTHLTLPTNREV